MLITFKKNIMVKKKLFYWILVFASGGLLTGCSFNPRGTINDQEEMLPSSDEEIFRQLPVKEEKKKTDETGEEEVVNAKLEEDVSTGSFSAPQEGNYQYLDKYDQALISTSKGKIKVKFYNKETPLTVENFLNLSAGGFYEGTKFHRVIKDFMIQGGDPNSKDNNKSNDGQGGPGYSFKDEIHAKPLVKGSLAMANSGPNTNGSQFFIVTAQATAWLDGKHTNFGEVIEGLEVVEAIENSATDEKDYPQEDIVIEKIELLKSN